MDKTAKFSESQREIIIKALIDKGVASPCPMCKNKKFSVLDGYFKHSVQLGLKRTILGGPTVPAVVVICDNCGFMSQHAIGILGILDKLGGKV